MSEERRSQFAPENGPHLSGVEGGEDDQGAPIQPPGSPGLLQGHPPSQNRSTLDRGPSLPTSSILSTFKPKATQLTHLKPKSVRPPPLPVLSQPLLSGFHSAAIPHGRPIYFGCPVSFTPPSPHAGGAPNLLLQRSRVSWLLNPNDMMLASPDHSPSLGKWSLLGHSELLGLLSSSPLLPSTPYMLVPSGV